MKAYFWQSRRKLEKIEEIENRKRLLQLNNISLNKLPHISKQNLEEFTRINFDCEFLSDKRHIKIIKTIDNEPGYKYIIPVKIKDSNQVKNIIFVDYGWFPKSLSVDKLSEYLFDNIDGIIYYGDKKSKYTNNDLKNGMLITTHIDELKSLFPDYEKNIIDDVMIKRINFTNQNNNKSSTYPITPFIDELLVWYINPHTHQNYARFWAFATFSNLITNLYVWLLI